MLDLTNNRIGAEGMLYFTAMIHNNNCPNLEELSLISRGDGALQLGNRIQDEGLLKLVYEIKFGFLPHLKTLYLSDNGLHDRSVVQLATMIADKHIAQSAELYIGCIRIVSTETQATNSLQPPSKHSFLSSTLPMPSESPH